MTGCGRMEKKTTAEAEAAAPIREQIIVKTYTGSQAEATRSFQADEAQMAAQGYLPVFQSWAPGPVATRSFYCCTSALLSDCWHSRAHLHAHRDARRCLDRDLWVQGSTIAGSLCNLESIFGQLYPATLLARLVTLELADRGVHEAVHGTFETCRFYRAMSVFRRNPEDICSH